MEDMEPKYDLVETGYSVQEPVTYFAMILRGPNKIRLVSVGPDLVRCIQERLEQLVRVRNSGYVIFKDYQMSFTGRFNVYDMILDNDYFATNANSKEDMTLIKVAFCRILGALFCYGYDPLVSSDLARDLQSTATVFFKLREPHDLFPLHFFSHKFICIAPHGNDSILLINVPKIAVDPILKTIHLTWSPGIKSKQTLADDERSVSVVISLKLAGTPWNQAVYNSGKATIQARLIILELTRILATFKWRLAMNINFNGTTDSFFYQWCPNMDFDDVHFCALILSRYDRLRLLQVPTALTPVIKDCINHQWHLQLLKQREYHGTTEFKLGGCPWWADGNDAIESRYFISCLVGSLKASGWEVCGTIDLSRHNNDKSTFLLKQSPPQDTSHMCISFSKTNRIRLIVSSSDISEEAELQLTTRINEIIKQHWVALGPRNYGKSIEWKLEGDPWDTEGLYSDQTRGIYLLCLLLEAIQPLGWRLVSSADISSKNLDGNERGYSLVGRPEDLHTWFFLFDESLSKVEINNYGNHSSMYRPYSSSKIRSISSQDMVTGSSSVPNLEADHMMSHSPQMGYPYDGHTSRFGSHSTGYGMDNTLMQQQAMSRSVPSVAAISAPTAHPFDSFNQFHHPQQSHQMYTSHHRGSIQLSNVGGSQQSLRQDRQMPGYIKDSMQIQDNHRQQFYGNSELDMKRPFSCMANERCQSRQKSQLTRQASAGSLPPESLYQPFMARQEYHYQPRPSFHSNGSLNHDMAYQSQSHLIGMDHEGGYKSDGEGYRSEKARYQKHHQYRSCMNSPTHEIHSKQDMRPGSATYFRSHIPHQHEGCDNNGQEYHMRSSSNMSFDNNHHDQYLANHNSGGKRISKSGKFGSQNSSLYKAGNESHGEARNDGSEMMDRLNSQTPDSVDDDVDNLNLGGENLLTNYSRFQAEANCKKSVSVPVDESSCEELFNVGLTKNNKMGSSNGSRLVRQESKDHNKSSESVRSRQGSRSNSRLGMNSSTSERSESQTGVVPKQSLPKKAGNNGTAVDPVNNNTLYKPDDYRSEGSTESPMQNESNVGKQQRPRKHQNQQDLDMIQVANEESTGDGSDSNTVRQANQCGARVKCGTKYQSYGKRSNSKDRLSNSALPCTTSKSLNSFERQESSTSFHSGQSGHSTHSAPPYHSQTKIHSAKHSQRHNQQREATSAISLQPVYQNQRQLHQQQPHYHQRHCQLISNMHGNVGGGPPVSCLESCSTQSSSSSASAPPDYDACAGIPPSYDQAIDISSLMHKPRRHQHEQVSHHYPSNHYPQDSMQQQFSISYAQTPYPPQTPIPPHQLQHKHQYMGNHQQPQVRGYRQMPPRQHSVQGIPQAKPILQQNSLRKRPEERSGSIRSNQLYYMGEFYG